jgi:type 1 glutamine amidotransferase
MTKRDVLKSAVRTALIGVALAAGLSAQQVRSTGPRKLQALIVTGQDAHPWRESTPYIKYLLEQTGRFEVRVAEEVRGATLDSFTPYDVLILNYSDEKLTVSTWTQTTKDALLQYARSGKGIVVYHHAAASFQNWPEYEKLVGCVWRSSDSHHAPVHDYQVDVRDSEHPITRGMGAFMARTDELYAGLKCLPAGSFHILASGFDDHALYAARPGAKVPTGPSQDEPLIWTLNYGAGRVFATMLGNDMRAVHTPGFIATLTRGAEWAATGEVTIPLPQELRK